MALEVPSLPVDIPASVAGSVLEVLVAPGDAVAAGQEVAIIESMKMEIAVEAPAAGTIAEVLVAVSDPVQEGQSLFRLQ